MSSTADLRKAVSDSAPLLALVGAADLAAARLRSAAAHAPLDHASREHLTQQAKDQVQHQVDLGLALVQTVASRAASLDPSSLRAKLDVAVLQAALADAQAKALTTVVTTALTTAGKVETEWSKLADRGRTVVGVVADQKAAEQLISRGKVTVTRARTVATAGRKAAADLAGAATGPVPVPGEAPAQAHPTDPVPAEDTTAATPAAAKAARRASTKVAASSTGTAKTGATKAKRATKAASSGSATGPGRATSSRGATSQTSPAARSRARKVVADAPVETVTPLDVAQAIDPEATTPIPETHAE